MKGSDSLSHLPKPVQNDASRYRALGPDDPYTLDYPDMLEEAVDTVLVPN
jgi:hypothetical protein